MKTRRELSCRYLYTDGTLIEAYEERRDGVVIGSTVDVTFGYCQLSMARRAERWNKEAVQGRIILHRGAGADGILTLAKGGRIDASMASIEAGSENTKKRDIPVQHVTLTTAKQLKLEWTETPTLLSGTFYLQEMEQPDHDKLKVGYSWGMDSRIWKVTDLRPKTAAAGVAAD
jgi:hypothetical protein